MSRTGSAFGRSVFVNGEDVGGDVGSFLLDVVLLLVAHFALIVTRGQYFFKLFGTLHNFFKPPGSLGFLKSHSFIFMSRVY